VTGDWDKDAWILAAIKDRYIAVEPSGRVTRRVPKGNFFLRTPMRTRTHKKSGRVIFDMTFLGITKTVLLNRVVALALIPNPLNLPEVNHKNGDKQDNSVGNLEWADRSTQERHAQSTGLKSGRGSANSNAKLTAAQVTAIRNSAEPIGTLAASHGVSVKTVRDIQSNKTWKHL